MPVVGVISEQCLPYVSKEGVLLALWGHLWILVFLCRQRALAEKAANTAGILALLCHCSLPWPMGTDGSKPSSLHWEMEMGRGGDRQQFLPLTVDANSSEHASCITVCLHSSTVGLCMPHMRCGSRLD